MTDENAKRGEGMVPVERVVVEQNPPPNGGTPHLDPAAPDQELLAKVVEFYARALQDGPEAHAFLKKRGLDHPELIQTFRLGYANRTLGLTLPPMQVRAGREIRSRLTRLGIYRESGHEHLSGSLVVPVFDEQGQVVTLYGRKVGSNLRQGTPLHLHVPTEPGGVWNLAGLAASRTVILAGSLLDAMTWWAAGHRAVTCTLGTMAPTREHLDAFRRHGVERVAVAFRRTPEGDEAAAQVVAMLRAQGLRAEVVQFPHRMDANDYAHKLKPASKSLGLLLPKDMEQATQPGGIAEALEALADTSPQPSASDATRPTPALEARLTEATPEKPAQASQEGQGEVQEAPRTLSTTPTPADSPAPAQEPNQLDSAGQTVGEVVLTLEQRRYRVRGLEQNSTLAVLKINLLVTREGAPADQPMFHIDTLDLYQAKQRAAFIKQAAIELGCSEEVIKRDLGRVLLRLEELQEQALKKALEPKAALPQMTSEEHEAALALLRDPQLLDRVVADFERCGVVGESTNKLVGYLAAISRKLDAPLAIVIQSSSAAGKTSLMDAILAFVPPEERLQFSAMTGQSLYYLGGSDLAHKILAIAEEEGAERASYALKLLQSEGELTIASTGKDASTGRMVTQEYKVTGPVGLFLTTTAIDLDEELLNRCVVLTVDEEREQTRAIHRLQRERQTLQGLLAEQERAQLIHLHQNAQRLLRALKVVNPYAPRLTFLDDRPRTRRDHTKYLALIRTIALLHQHQRPVKTITHEGRTIEYIEVIPADIATANRLADQVLGRSLDEVPPHTRRLLLQLVEVVATVAAERSLERQDCWLTRKEIRERTGWGNTQLKVHLARLVELEYLLPHRSGAGYAYELLFDGRGKDGAPFLAGLIDPAALTYDGSQPEPGRPLAGPGSAGGRGGETTGTSRDSAPLAANRSVQAENAHMEPLPEASGVVPTGEGS